MTLQEKSNYLRIALNMQNVGIDNLMAEQVIITYEKMMEKRGKFSVDDAAKIIAQIEQKRKDEAKES